MGACLCLYLSIYLYNMYVCVYNMCVYNMCVCMCMYFRIDALTFSWYICHCNQHPRAYCRDSHTHTKFMFLKIKEVHTQAFNHPPPQFVLFKAK